MKSLHNLTSILSEMNERIGNKKILISVRRGLTYMIPLILLGSLALVFISLPIPAYQNMMQEIFGAQWKNIPSYIRDGTFNILSIIMVISISSSLIIEYQKDRSLEINPIIAASVSLASFIAITGLHHVINNIAWFLFGTFKEATGDLHRFFAGDPNAGIFMTGFFPVMMFGLPAAALAMIKTAKPQNRKAVTGALLGIAFTSFLTGITEPIEFMFMFLAPVLYFGHAILTGASLAVTYILGIRHGFGFSGGAIDYFLNMNLATKGWLIIPIGIVFAIIYYFMFVIIIEKMNLPTPGRLDDEAGSSESIIADKGISGLAQEYINKLGGKENILELDSCITRLRLTVADSSIISDDDLKALGASGIIRPNKKNMQVVVGTKAELIVDEMKKLL